MNHIYYSLGEAFLPGMCFVIGMFAIITFIAFIVILIDFTISEVLDSLPNREKPREKIKEEDNKTDKNNYLKL